MATRASVLFAHVRTTHRRKGEKIPRILLVFEFGTLNGGERSMLAVLPQFVGTDLEFVALTPADGPLAGALGALGVPVLTFDARGENRERREPSGLVEEIRSAAARARPDLIHGNSLAMARLTGTLAADLRVPTTAHLRDIIGLTRRAVEQLNANRALVAVSQAVRDFHAAQGVERNRMHIVYNGINEEPFRRHAGGTSLKDELRLPPDAFLVATIGQICLRKAQDIFAKAAVLAAPRMPKAHFLMIGERYSEKTESALYEEAINFECAMGGLKERFHRLGYRADVERLMSEIDLVAHCARQEPFGRVLLEAAAAQRPIVATKIGGTEEMLVHDQSAILVPPDNPEALAEAMVRLYGDAELSSRLAAAARERVANRFSIEQAAHELADVWRTVI
jgi:glycosyltransferase involved in cell wall biosynthesis